MKFIHYKHVVNPNELIDIKNLKTESFIPYEKKALKDFKKIFLEKGKKFLLDRLSELHKLGYLTKISDVNYKLTKIGRIVSYNLIEYDIQILEKFINRVIEVMLKFGIKPGQKVIDIGCGAGQSLYGFSVAGSEFCLGIDISLYDLLVGEAFNEYFYKKESINFLHADAINLPVKSNSFDFVFTKGVLIYLDREKAFREVTRVLQAGGFFIGINPGYKYYLLSILHSLTKKKLHAKYLFAFINGLFIEIFNKQLTLKSYYGHFETKRSLRKLLEKNNFSVVTIERVPGEYVLDSSLLFIAKKKS